MSFQFSKATVCALDPTLFSSVYNSLFLLSAIRILLTQVSLILGEENKKHSHDSPAGIPLQLPPYLCPPPQGSSPVWLCLRATLRWDGHLPCLLPVSQNTVIIPPPHTLLLPREPMTPFY